MTDDQKTLGELLSDPRIGKIAADAIRNLGFDQKESGIEWLADSKMNSI